MARVLDVSGLRPLNDMLLARLLSRVTYHIKSGKPYAVLGAFGDANRLEENTERQWLLMQDVEDLEYRYVPIVTAFDGITHRSVFVFNMVFQDAKTIAQKSGLNIFTFGESGDWGLFGSNTGDPVTPNGYRDGPLEVLSLDLEVMAYAKNRGRKFILAEAKGFLGKYICIRKDGVVYIPGIPIPKTVGQGIRNFKVEVKAASIDIPDIYEERWILNPNDLLESIHKYRDTPIGKFAFEPRSGELLLCTPGMHHDSEILNIGRFPFDDYVRAIVLNKNRIVAFRPLFPTYLRDKYNPAKMTKAERVEYGLKDFELQFSTMEALRANGSVNWEYRFNINNRMLEELTGEAGW